MEEEIKNCPHCGSGAIVQQGLELDYPQDKRVIYVECMVCNARGKAIEMGDINFDPPEGVDIEDTVGYQAAIEAWNMRAEV